MGQLEGHVGIVAGDGIDQSQFLGVGTLRGSSARSMC